MNIFESIRAQLAATTAITDIVGTRIYHGERPQNSALPALAFDETGDAESFQDILGAPIGLARVGIRLECFAAASGAAHTLRAACRTALESWTSSPMGGSGGANVWGCNFSGQSSAYDPEVEIVAKYLDFEVMYSEEGYAPIPPTPPAPIGADELPEATEELRGTFYFTRGGTGETDNAWVCCKLSDESYYWRLMTGT